MNYRIVADSSSNVLSMDNPHYVSVPMKVRAEKEYLDDRQLDVAQMVEDLKHHKGTSGSSCPNVGEWLDAFDDADFVFGTTMSKNLSGSYNAAMQAADTYMEENPGKKAYIFNTLSAGPQQMFLNEKVMELADQGLDFETIKEKEAAGEVDRFLFGARNVSGLHIITAAVANADAGKLQAPGHQQDHHHGKDGDDPPKGMLCTVAAAQLC